MDSSGVNFTSSVYLWRNKRTAELWETNEYPSNHNLYQTCCIIWSFVITTVYHRLYTGFGTQPGIVNRHGELFTWSSDQSVKLFTLFPLDLMCQHRDKFMFNRLWNFSYIVLDYCKKKIYELLQVSACDNEVTWRHDVSNTFEEFLISNFRRVLNIVYFLLGISPASD
jgi:hypothetical protein